MPATTAVPKSSAKRAPALRGACEKSARDLVSVISLTSRKSPAALIDLVDSLASVIERTTELLLAGTASCRYLSAQVGSRNLLPRPACDAAGLSDKPGQHALNLD